MSSLFFERSYVILLKILIKAMRILQVLHAEQTVCVTTEATHIKLKKEKMSKMKQTEQFNDDSRNNNQIIRREKNIGLRTEWNISMCNVHVFSMN